MEVQGEQIIFHGAPEPDDSEDDADCVDEIHGAAAHKDSVLASETRLRAYYDRMLPLVLEAVQSGRVVLYTLAPRLDPYGAQRPSLTGHILDEFDDVFFDFALFPADLIEHRDNGTAQPLKAWLIDAARRALPRASLEPVKHRTVACGVPAARIAGDVAVAHVVHPAKWRMCPEEVYKYLAPLLRLDYEGFLERLSGAYVCYQGMRYALLTPAQRDAHSEAIAAAWAAKPEEEKAAFGQAVAERWAAKPEEEKAAFGQAIAARWAAMSHEERAAHSELLKSIWASKSPEEKTAHGQAIAAAWAGKSPEEKAAFGRSISAAWDAKTDAEKDTIRQLLSNVKTEWWATLTEEQRHQQCLSMAHGWAQVSDEVRAQRAEAQSAAWAALPDEEKAAWKAKISKTIAERTPEERAAIASKISETINAASPEERARRSAMISERWSALGEEGRAAVKARIRAAWTSMAPEQRQSISQMHAQRQAAWPAEKREAMARKIADSWKDLTPDQHTERRRNVGRGVKKAWAAKPKAEVAAHGAKSSQVMSKAWAERDATTRAEIIERGLEKRKLLHLQKFEKRIESLRRDTEIGNALTGDVRASVRKAWQKNFKDNPAVSATLRETVESLLNGAATGGSS